MKKTIITLSLLLIGSGLSSCTNKTSENPDPGLDKLMEDSYKEKAQENNLETNNDNMVKVNQLEAPTAGDKIAVFDTNMGKIKVKLFPEATPKTYENFAGLAEKGYYDGVIFHRVIKDFMVQGGDPNGTGMGGESLWGEDFEDEPHPDLKNIKGALSMANRGPNTNGSQFFIVQAESTPWLDGYQNGQKTCGQLGTSCHTVFGQVYEGMDIVNEIAEVDTNQMDKPTEDIIINTITIEEYK